MLSTIAVSFAELGEYLPHCEIYALAWPGVLTPTEYPTTSDINTYAKRAISLGFLTDLRWMRRSHLDFDADEAMVWAAEAGQFECMASCYDEWRATSASYAMSAAAKNGNDLCMWWCYDSLRLEMLRYDNPRHSPINLAGAVNIAMAEAASAGREHCMRICRKEWGATGLEFALKWAESAGQHSCAAALKRWIQRRGIARADRP